MRNIDPRDYGAVPIACSTAVIGGIVAWFALRGGLGVAGLALGLLPIAAGVGFVGRTQPRGLSAAAATAGFAFAFILLIWPVLWFGIGFWPY